MGDYNNPNDPLGTPEENPLGDIDPMAWLESLAIRQGASPEEMTTAADLEVPTIDPNSVTIDEPGYTPYEVFGQDTAQMQPPPDPAPPPAPEPVAFDPSGGIPDGVDPMAWLESLAKRQGVNSEELTTSANIDVPDIDPNSVVIDEPGYTPSEVIRSRHLPPPPTPEPPAAAAYDFETPPVSEPEAAYDFQQPAEPAQYDYSSQPDQNQYAQQGDWSEQGYAQPDQNQYAQQGDWLDQGYAQPDQNQYAQQGDWSNQNYQPDQGQYAQQGDWLDQGYAQPDQNQYAQQNDDWSNYQQEQQYAPAEPAYDFSPEPQAAPETASFDPSMGIPDDIDPMAWLESLAKRQGVNSEELTTAANIDVPEVDPNSVVIDEPGYTPSEVIRSRHLPPPPAPEPPAYQEVAPQAEAAPWGEATDFLDSLTDNMEPLPGIDFGAAPEADYGDASWLDSLGRESDDDLFGAPEPASEADFSFLGEPIAPPTVDDAIPATHTPEEVMASIEGMSEDDIMRAQVERRLTPAQELAWLQRQAMSLQKAREEAEFEELEDLDLPPAEAAEIPAWLQQSAVVSDNAALSAAFDDSVTPPPAPDDIPDWLHGDAAPQGQYAELELPDFTPEDASGDQPLTFEMPQVSDAAIGALNLEDYDPSQDEWASALDEEHDRISEGLAEDDPSWFRTAMEQASAEEEQEAIAPPLPTPLAPPAMPVASQTPDWLAGVAEEIAGAPEVPDDLPDWLRPAAVAISSEEGGFDDIGTWLREEQTGGPIFAPTDMLDFDTDLRTTAPAAPTPPAPPGEISVWLRGEDAGAAMTAEGEQLKPARTGPLPEWLQGAEPAQPPGMPTPMSAPPVAPRTVTPSARATGILTLPTNLNELAGQQESAPAAPAAPMAPPPIRQAPTATQQPAPAAGAPALVPAAFEGARIRLEQNPQDHPTRLQLARDLSRSGDLNNSLPQYQTLIEHQGELDAVVEDLRGLIQVNPQNPVARRLLGDTYMRQGYLQQALDAYRGALDSL